MQVNEETCFISTLSSTVLIPGRLALSDETLATPWLHLVPQSHTVMHQYGLVESSVSLGCMRRGCKPLYHPKESSDFGAACSKSVSQKFDGWQAQRIDRIHTLLRTMLLS